MLGFVSEDAQCPVTVQNVLLTNALALVTPSPCCLYSDSSSAPWGNRLGQVSSSLLIRRLWCIFRLLLDGVRSFILSLPRTRCSSPRLCVLTALTPVCCD
ncbi:uncharacterized [Tachysurus ichikawai]